MPDKEIVCEDCRQTFVWSESEQEFYRQKDFTPPKRCKPCRDKRKAARAARQQNGGGGRGRRNNYSHNRRG
jgi:hypothetical protein